MSTLSTDRKPLVDYGVQIRFIKDLDDTGGGYPDKSRGTNGATPNTNKYGVAVRVQGISGQPYVVLKDGDKGDSYGVQLNTPSSSSGSPSPYNSLPKANKEPAGFTNPYVPAANTARSPVSPAEDEDREIFGSPLKRPPGDGQAGTQGEEEGAAGRQGRVEKQKAEPQLKATASEVENNTRDCTDEYNEAGLKPVKLNGVGPRGYVPTKSGFTGSLGRYSGKKHSPFSPSKSFPAASAPANEEPPLAIVTDSLAPINKLINKFNSGTPGSAPQARGRSGARQRLKFDERKRSRSLDARKDVQSDVSLSSPTSPISQTLNPYASPISPTLNPYAAPLSASSNSLLSHAQAPSSLGRGPASVTKVSALEAPKPGFRSPGKFVAKNYPPSIAKKPEIPPRSKSTEVISGEEAQVKQSIFNHLKDSSESEGSLKRKVYADHETNGSFKKGGYDGRPQKANLEELQEQLNRCKKELQQAYDELAEERMAREGAETRIRLQEDLLAELQEDLRRVSENSPYSDSLQTDVVTLQADLAEAAMLRQRQEDTLHQRERELTALKGALKEEIECHDKEMEILREQYSQDMDNLRTTMEQVTQSQEQIEEERERVNASMLTLEDELESCREEGEEWKTQLEVTTQELHDTREESGKPDSSGILQKSCSEREAFESKVKDLQDSLLATKKQGPACDDNRSSAEELQRCHDDLKRTRADLDKQKGELDEKSKALQALKKASGEKEARLMSEIGKMKEQSQKDKNELEKALDKAKESSAGKTVVDQGANMELQEANARLRERLARMTRLHSSVSVSSDTDEAVEALEDENRSLKSQLEEAKRGATRMSKERDELTRRLEERDLEREALRRGKSDLEEQKRLLDRALEKINKEMEMMMGDSRQSVIALQTQLEDYRERSRKDLLEAQRNCKDRLAELQRSQNNLKAQQEEVSRLKKELLACSEERDSAQLERDLLSNRLKHLDSELETEKSTHTDRTREIRGLEDKIKLLEIELDEERSSVELLNDRISRSRDQVDQLRSELMQERSARHDLEMDKSAIERQMKEMKSRMADMEGQPRPTAGLSLLENKIQELEERLRSEEREKASIQASQRRMERKLKELNATLDQERTQHVEQRDQLSLRVKALKRQFDESEGEVERLEVVRRKVLRDLEEQQELQEAQQAKVTALETELKRKSQHTHRASLAPSTLSSEEEDGFFDANITSILHESHLQSNS
ncbi:cingulin isoform X3 [Hippoglossus hippoglossus]|uniref:cingulin isoform X3 n=1 Tax=Hippoglossus hippoglossus TaxID=8267 RepID=UPI00148E632C|nr:cingulin isoform X3 [Hippoglossus hippoglossus]